MVRIHKSIPNIDDNKYGISAPTKRIPNRNLTISFSNNRQDLRQQDAKRNFGTECIRGSCKGAWFKKACIALQSCAEGTMSFQVWGRGHAFQEEGFAATTARITRTTLNPNPKP